MTVLLIALAHAIPVIFIALALKTRNAVLITAAVMSVVAFFTGGIKYVIFDLAAIAAVTYMLLESLKKK
jgi:hypothetical protein